ncbi:hypothetical protein GH714_017951 [Hevea brasiliensis]|uniref:Thaumatin-like protein n=1 Tax=Hevea brasiliensis TaxID=3981 RepID=A0A6A6N487_HEVBR|nr:hypothetical protein GH714_017951 [Hevea brasiliensis]
MIFSKIPVVYFLFIALYFASAHAATFAITNNCPYTVWAAAVPGGGRRLDPHQTWPLTVNPGTTGARIWARTNCRFDGAGRGQCQTGDCGGLLQCTAYGTPPNTLAEFALNQFNNLDFFDISLVDGFNVPMEFSPTSGGCSRGITCKADINGQCPNVLRAPGGCNNPCTVYKTNEYCCYNGNCGPTDLSRFFKDRCRDAYSYPKDDQTSTFTCPGGTNYKAALLSCRATETDNCMVSVEILQRWLNGLASSVFAGEFISLFGWSICAEILLPRPKCLLIGVAVSSLMVSHLTGRITYG